MGSGYLAIALAGVFFWAFYKMLNPSKPKYAASDFLNQEKRSTEEHRVVSQSIIHQMIYPIHAKVQQMKPLSKSQYEEIQQELIKAGEYTSRPEDVQIAQLTNAVLYPLFFIGIAIFIGGDYQAYIVFAGIASGFYMYRTPMSTIKSKQKKHDEQLLQDFTRFVTVYLMQVSGNMTPDEALKKAINRTSDKTLALSYYLETLASDIETKGTSRALRELSDAMSKTYIDRFANNVQLAIKHAGGDQTNLNLRLRESLAEMSEQVVDGKIASMKVKARIPTFMSVGIIAIYMIVMLGFSMMMLL